VTRRRAAAVQTQPLRFSAVILAGGRSARMGRDKAFLARAGQPLLAHQFLNALVGRIFEIQGVQFQGVEECRPCYWMNHAFRDERVEAWLRGRGGLRARILTDGWLRRDV